MQPEGLTGKVFAMWSKANAAMDALTPPAAIYFGTFTFVAPRAANIQRVFLVSVIQHVYPHVEYIAQDLHNSTKPGGLAPHRVDTLSHDCLLVVRLLSCARLSFLRVIQGTFFCFTRVQQTSFRAI